MRTLDVSVLDRPSRTAAEWLWPLVPIGAAVFCLSALIYYRVRYEAVQVRSAMQEMIAGIYRAFGFAPAVMFFLLLGTWSTIWFVTSRIDKPLSRIARLLAMAVMMGVFLNLGDGGVSAATHKGVVGAWLAGCLVSAIGYYPSLVVVWIVTFAALLLATDFFFSDSFERLRHRPRSEVGVEASVTDHLRGLASAVPVAEPGLRAAPAPVSVATAIETAPELDFLRELAVETPEAEVSPEEEGAGVAYEPRRRRSYFDRRHDLDAVGDASEQAPVSEPAAQDLDVAVAAEWGPDTVLLDAVPPPAEAPVARAAEAVTTAAEDTVDDEPVVGAADEPVADEPARPAPSFVDLEDAPAAARANDAHAAFEDEEDEENATDEENEADAVDAEVAEPAGALGDEAYDLDGEPVRADARDDDADDDAVAESTIAIPRPEHPPRDRVPSAPRTPSRQQPLFAAEVDGELLQDALDLVAGQGRVTAVLLQRRLRIDYQQAIDVLAELGARGVVELDADATQGRVVV